MKISFLTSNTPLYGNHRAGSTVQFALALQAATQGISVDIHLMNGSSEISPKTLAIFRDFNINIFDWGQCFPPNQAFQDFPAHNSFGYITEFINSKNYDQHIYFWDSKAEFTLPYINGFKVGYLAQPICQAWLSLLCRSLIDERLLAHHEPGSLITVCDQLKYYKQKKELGNHPFIVEALRQQLKHIDNLRFLNRSFCIANGASYWYNKHSIINQYLPNCWPSYSLERPETTGFRNILVEIPHPPRRLDSCSLKPIRILANIGRIDSHTGNLQGLDYLQNVLIPLVLKFGLSNHVEFLIVGAGEPISRHRQLISLNCVKYLGFVPNFESIIEKSDCLLILNNLGNYQAGYTRVMVAFSKGLPVIASNSISIQIPEITTNNTFLFSTSEILFEIISGLSTRNPFHVNRYNEISSTCLPTYSDSYAPTQIINRLICC